MPNLSHFGDEDGIIKMSKVGSLKECGAQKESWTSYVERFECYCLANSVKNELQVPTFLASMGASVYRALHATWLRRVYPKAWSTMNSRLC